MASGLTLRVRVKWDEQLEMWEVLLLGPPIIFEARGPREFLKTHGIRWRS